MVILLDLSPSSITNAVNRNSSMRAEHSLILAKHLNTSVEQLVLGEDYIPSSAEVLLEQIRGPISIAFQLINDSSGSLQKTEPQIQQEQNDIQPPFPDNIEPFESPKTNEVCGVGTTAAGPPIDMGQGYGTVMVDRRHFKDPTRAHFAVKVSGTSMTGAGINDGDLCLIRAANVPEHGEIMLVLHEGALTLKLIKEEIAPGGGVKSFHPYYVDGSGREVRAEEDDEEWRAIGRFVCTFEPVGDRA